MLRPRRLALIAPLALLAGCTPREAPPDEEARPSPNAAAPNIPPDVPPAAGATRGRWVRPCVRIAEDVGAGAAADTVCFRDTREVDFAGDGRPFLVTVDARGPRADSMRVTLRVTRGDTVHYQDDWSTRLYANYDQRRVPADSARRRAEGHLGRLLGDSAFRPTATFLGGAGDVDRALRETIAFDLRVNAERRRRGLAPGAPLPVEASQSPRPTADTARAGALAAELLGRPAFRYYAGGEATYAVAWSPDEGRFVVVYSCC